MKAKSRLLALTAMAAALSSGIGIGSGIGNEKARERQKDPLTKQQKIKRARTKAQRKARKLHRK